MKFSPCKDCPKRELRCHATCEEYLKFKEERDQYLEDMYAEKSAFRLSPYQVKLDRRNLRNGGKSSLRGNIC